MLLKVENALDPDCLTIINTDYIVAIVEPFVNLVGGDEDFIKLTPKGMETLLKALEIKNV